MAKKIAINTPFGGFEYQWEPTLKGSTSDKKLVKRILKSFSISIESGDNINSHEIDSFLKTLRNFGHLEKFSKDELEEYKKLINISKSKKQNILKKINFLIGIWKGSYTIQAREHKVLLRFREENGEFLAEMDINWTTKYHNSLTEYFHLKIQDDLLILQGIKVKFYHRGDADEKRYNLDNFIFLINEESSILKGKLIDINQENWFELGKIEL